MIKSRSKKESRNRRSHRIRARVTGSSVRPRLTINKSNYLLYAQFIDDEKGHTLVSAAVKGKNIKAAQTLAAAISSKAKTKKIQVATLDRRGFRYHGVVKAFADSVREGGIKI